MPDIDVSDLLFDPDIAGTTFDVIRRQETVGANGVASVAPTTFEDVVGSITPTGDNSLVREEGYSTQSNTIKVITTFRLRGPSKDAGHNFQPDIVVWNGTNYEVKSLNEFTPFGAGFVEADCISIDFTAQAPQ